MRDIRLQPRSWWELRPFRLLCSKQWYFLTDVTVQLISPVSYMFYCFSFFFFSFLTWMISLDSVSHTSKFSTPRKSSFQVAPMTAPLPPPCCHLYQACRLSPRYWDLQRPHSSLSKPRTSRVPGFLFGILTHEDGTDRSSRNAVRNYHYTLRNKREEHRNYEIKNPSYVLNFLLFGSFILPLGAEAPLAHSILPQLRYRHNEQRIQNFCYHVGCVIILGLNAFCAAGGCVL